MDAINPEFTIPTPIIDERRLSEITEIGQIIGGECADVLAVSYGPSETIVRIRYEQTGRRESGTLKSGSMAEFLNEFAEFLYQSFPYKTKPVVLIHRGNQAQKWVRRFAERMKRASRGRRNATDRNDERRYCGLQSQ